MSAFGGKLTCLNLACGLSLIALSSACGEEPGGDDTAADATTLDDDSTETSTTTDTETNPSSGDGDGDAGDGDTSGDGDTGDGDGEMTLPDDPERDWYIWQQGEDDTWVSGLAAVADGVLVVSSRPHSSGELGTEGVLTKYDADGEEVWEQIIDSDVPCGSNCSRSTDLVVTDSGDIIVAGALRQELEGALTLRVDALLATFASDGTPGWSQTWSGTQDDGLDDYNNLAVDPADGSIYAVGAWENDNLFDAMLRKYDSTGTALWEVNLSGPATASSDSLNGVAVASNGDVVVTGRQEAAGLEGADQLVVARYDSDGNELWMDLHDQNASLYDSGSDVSTDANGNAFVVGTVDSGNLERHDMWFTLYDAGGNKTWSHLYDGIATGDCEAQTIVCDRANDGALLADGNFGIAGETHATKTDRSAFVGIFNAAGDVLWERLVDGEENLRDRFSALSEAPDGSIYVGGYMETEAGGSDWFLAKYSPEY